METYGDKKDAPSWALHYAQVKANITQPQKNNQVKVKTRNGSDFSYKYASLSDIDSAIMDAIRKVTDDNGNVQFSYLFDVETDNTSVTVQTVLIDVTGYTVKDSKVIFSNSKAYDAQATASLITYAKRYSLSGAFGIAADDDNDAQNYRQQVVKPKRLTKQELERYEVEYNGIQANLMDLYEEASEGVKDAQDWLKSSHTAQDASAIHQVAELFKKRKKSDSDDDQQKAIKAATKKIKPKKSVEDPFKDQATGDVPADVENLF